MGSSPKVVVIAASAGGLLAIVVVKKKHGHHATTIHDFILEPGRIDIEREPLRGRGILFATTKPGVDGAPHAASTLCRMGRAWFAAVCISHASPTIRALPRAVAHGARNL